MKPIAGKCDICNLYVEDLYDGKKIAELLELVTNHNEDFLVCENCLTGIEEAVKSAWSKKVDD